MLVTVDEGGKAVALAVRPAWRAHARAAGPCLRPTCAARARARPGSSSWRRRRGCSTATCWRPASTTSWPCVQWLSERYSTGQQINTRRIAIWRFPGRSGWSRCWPRSLDERIAGAAQRPVRREPRGAARREPARSRRWRFRSMRSRRSTWPTSRGSAGPAGSTSPADASDGAAIVGSLLDALEASASIRELADGIWSCEQHDGPRIIRQVVIAGDEAALVVDTGLPGAPAADLCRCSRGSAGEISRCSSRIPTATTSAGTAELLATHPGCARARRCAGPAAGRRSRADDPRALRALRRGRRRAVRGRGDRPRARRVPASRSTGAEAALPGARVELGGRAAEILATPGHSPGPRRRVASPTRRARSRRRRHGQRRSRPRGRHPTSPRCTRRRPPTARRSSGWRALPPRILADRATSRSSTARRRGAFLDASRPRRATGSAGSSRRCSTGPAHAAGSCAAACTRRTAACRPTASATSR